MTAKPYSTLNDPELNDNVFELVKKVHVGTFVEDAMSGENMIEKIGAIAFSDFIDSLRDENGEAEYEIVLNGQTITMAFEAKAS